MVSPTREAYGKTIELLGNTDDSMVVLDADISKSTRTVYFAEKHPDRFINVGVAEQNMFGIAAGLATCGKTPFCSTYSVFASMRACEQIRTSICYPNLNVKICVSHGGITPANDGVTHQAIEDMGIMRTLPNMTVMMPADWNSTTKLVQAAHKLDGPVYIRFTRDKVPDIYDENETFEIGKAKVLRQGKDVTIVAIGDMLQHALKAADILNESGIEADVIDVHTLKPLDRETLSVSIEKTKAVVTVENHSIINGLGSAVSELIAEKIPARLKRIGLKDTFAESGKYEELLEKYGMSCNHIVEEAKKLVQNRG